VNSSYFGFAREISSVRQAITLVGVRTIKNFALWSAVFSLMPNPKCGPFDLKSLWQDSLRRGLFARAMGKVMGQRDAEDLFAAALLQDMAVPLLAKELSQKYVSVLEARAKGERRLSEIERETFGWTHADAAAQMARSWSLPEEFSRLIEAHVDLPAAAAKLPAEPGPYCVALSALLPASADEHWHDRGPFVEAFTAARPSGPSIDSVLSQVDKQFAEFAPVLKVTVPKRTLVDCLQAEAQPV
jgi:HD-like signal output (HDOD) protein